MHKQLERNTAGRDFAVGDMHGTLGLLFRLLDYVKFDPSRDRLISVGDLVDRGPDSLGCLRLLREPWFHAVPGNHEELMLTMLELPQLAERRWYPNGGGWAAAAISSIRDGNPTEQAMELLALKPLVEALPAMISVPVGDEIVRIIHAELPPRGSMFGQRLTDETLLEQFDWISHIPTIEGPWMQWGRSLFKPFTQQLITLSRSQLEMLADKLGDAHLGLSPIISGHSIVQQPICIYGFINIDTGAFMHQRDIWAGLTMMQLDEGRFFTARASKVREVTAITVDDSIMSRAFEDTISLGL